MWRKYFPHIINAVTPPGMLYLLDGQHGYLIAATVDEQGYLTALGRVKLAGLTFPYRFHVL